MHLIYFDEVKFEPPKQRFHWFGGFAISSNDVAAIEGLMNNLAKDWFGDPKLSKETEFHAKDIVHGKALFKGVPIDERLELLGKLLDICARDEVNSIFSCVEWEEVKFSGDPAEVAFMFFVEKVDSYLKFAGSVGLLIGDLDLPFVDTSVANLSSYKAGSTKYSYGRKIDYCLDTVHFAHSHHSRLVQLADIDIYARQFCRGDNTAPWRQKFLEQIKKTSSERFPVRYKDYPLYTAR